MDTFVFLLPVGSPSFAISCHQLPSVAKSCHQLPILAFFNSSLLQFAFCCHLLPSQKAFRQFAFSCRLLLYLSSSYIRSHLTFSDFTFTRMLLSKTSYCVVRKKLFRSHSFRHTVNYHIHFITLSFTLFTRIN